MSSGSNSEIGYLNTIKVILIMQVVIGHIYPLYLTVNEDITYASILIKSLFRYGAESAVIFVYLSGYFVGFKVISNLENNRFHIWEFIRSRLLKIYPILVFATIFTLIVDFVGIYVFGFDYYSGNLYSSLIVDNMNISNLIGNLLFLQPTFIEPFGSNGPLWTLGYIFQFYFIFALSVSFKNVRRIFAVNFILISVMIYYNLEWGLMYLCWCCGALNRKVEIKINKDIFVVGFVLLTVLASSANLIDFNLFIFLFAVLGLFLNLNNKRFSYIESNLMSKLSSEVYPIYVLHFPIVYFFYYILASVSTEYKVSLLMFNVFLTGVFLFLIINYCLKPMLRFFNYGK